jgi:hypothetical protein
LNEPRSSLNAADLPLGLVAEEPHVVLGVKDDMFFSSKVAVSVG